MLKTPPPGTTLSGDLHLSIFVEISTVSCSSAVVYDSVHIPFDSSSFWATVGVFACEGKKEKNFPRTSGVPDVVGLPVTGGGSPCTCPTLRSTDKCHFPYPGDLKHIWLLNSEKGQIEDIPQMVSGVPEWVEDFN
ncbi:hypothetical protein MG293_004689 [Ovis ammon polii]|uniref:Uncharacterized protein n=1 Tax=Ovis ammon polii TaxID=230172 RepID=A0AAD4YDY7_OVIAM|nr:hypothetical protein MG293_004689 [Ovis ammon polii]